MKLVFLTEDRVLAKATLWLRKSMDDHVLLAIPRLRLEQRVAIEIAEGASLLKVFHEATCWIDGKYLPARVLGGMPELFRTGAPVLVGSIFLLPGRSDPPRLSTLITSGVRMLRE